MNNTATPPLPLDTAQAARSIFNIHNVYLAIGDQFDQLFGDLNPAGLDESGNKSENNLCLLALVTIFQASERLPDRLAVEALRKRTDWKYALHLAMDYPGLDPAELCEFRQRLVVNAQGQAEFHRILSRLSEVGLFSSRSTDRMETRSVLLSVCSLTRLDWIIQAMYQALEGLAVYKPELLRAVTLPHWYERYQRMAADSFLMESSGEQNGLLLQIGNDIQHMLKAVESNPDQGLARTDEIQNLKLTFQQQYRQEDGRVVWREGC